MQTNAIYAFNSKVGLGSLGCKPVKEHANINAFRSLGHVSMYKLKVSVPSGS